MPVYNIAFYGAAAFLAGTLVAGSGFPGIQAILFFLVAAATLLFFKKLEWHLSLFFIFIFTET